MPRVLTMAAKDLRLMSRNWLGMFFIIGFPILMGIFFGSIMGSMGADNASKLSVAIVDKDRSATSDRFIAELKGDGKIELQPLEREAAMDSVRRGHNVGMIAIPKGFGDTAGLMWIESPAIEVGVDPSRKAEAAMLQGNIMQAMGKLMFARLRDPATLRPALLHARAELTKSEEVPALLRPALNQLMDSLDLLSDSLVAEQTQKMASGNDANAHKSGGPQFQLARIQTIDVTRQAPKGSTQELIGRMRSKWDISFPQAMMWGVLACAAGFAITIVRERMQGTFLRLQVAPVSRGQVVAGKATACFIAVLAVISLMVALGVWLGMRPRSPGLMVVAALSIAFCFVGIMMLMSVVGRSEEAVSGAAWGSNMLMAMFGGGMIPLLFMPPFMRALSNASPVKWSILALEGSIWRGFTPAEMLLPCGILVGIGAVCLACGWAVLSRATS